MKWLNDEVEFDQVSKHSEWMTLSRMPHTDLNSEPGIFILADESGVVKYIGKSFDSLIIKEIISSHLKGKSLGADKVKVLYTNDNETADILHRILINKYKPPINMTW